MADFLLELRSEEIPARMQAGARGELEKLFRRELEAAGVSPGEITVWSTPRRLALIARNLPIFTQAVREEAKGPPVGAPDKAVDGFCRKNNVARDTLEKRDVKGRETWFAVIEKPGQQVSDLHKELLSSAWLELLEQGKFDQQDLTWIEKLRGELEVPETEVESEWAVVKELLSIKETDKNLSPITDSSASSLLNPDETLYATGPAHLLHNVKLNSSGLKDDKEAQYFITSQRVLIRGAKNTEIPLKVLDRIELNVDQRYLLLHCKGELKTTRFRTQNPVETGILLSNMENAA